APATVTGMVTAPSAVMGSGPDDATGSSESVTAVPETVKLRPLPDWSVPNAAALGVGPSMYRAQRPLRVAVLLSRSASRSASGCTVVYTRNDRLLASSIM